MKKQPHRIDAIVSDFGVLNLMFLVCGLWLSKNANIWQWLGFFAAINTVWAFLSIDHKAYAWYERVRLEKELYRVSKVVVMHWAVMMVLNYYAFLHFISMDSLLGIYLLFWVSIVLGRAILRKISPIKSPSFSYILVGGKRGTLEAVLRAFSYAFENNAKCLGRFGNTDHPFINNIADYPDLKQYVQEVNGLQKVFYIYSELENEAVFEIMQICRNRSIDFEVIPREIDLFPRGINIQFQDDVPVLVLKDEPLFSLRNKLVKRGFDLLFSSLVVLLVFPWLLPIIALLIKWESKGPVFFLQQRTGYRNKPFNMIKFRTMTVNRDSDEKQATRGDQRVTRIGAFLRKTSLDEFPQFLNVFLGDMSVVGPRPHMLKHTDDYSRMIDHYMIRHNVKPGVTGWAQINGWRGPTETLEKMEKRVEFDVWYIENWNLLLDIKCIIYTVINAVKGEENAL